MPVPVYTKVEEITKYCRSCECPKKGITPGNCDISYLCEGSLYPEGKRFPIFFFKTERAYEELNKTGS